MKEDREKRLDNTINLIAEVLEKNKDNQDVKEAYKDMQRLKEKRGI